MSIKHKGFARALGVVDLSKITKSVKWPKKDIQREMRQSYWSYVESIITPIGMESKEEPGLKRFWTFIKHSRSDTSGISSLSDETGNKASALDQVANIFNTQFQSVFTIESPVSHDLLQSISPFQSMPDILISESGVLKLLQELKVYKAGSLDQIRPRVLQELSHIRAPILYAKYGKFNIGDDQAKYRLQVGSYSGTAGDSLTTRNNNMAFSTKDRDNDGASSCDQAQGNRDA